MFQCTIELLNPTKQSDDEPRFFGVAKFDFDPGLEKEEELWINCEVWDKFYKLKVKVIGRQKEVHAPSNKSRTISEETTKEGVFRLRIFVEAEDRDKAIEIKEAIRSNIDTLRVC